MADLVTLAEVKAYLGINSTNEDAKLTSLITKTSQFIKTYCGFSIIDHYEEDKIEIFNGGPQFLLAEYPLNSLTSVEYSSDYGQTYTPLIVYTDYVYNSSKEAVTTVTGKSFANSINGYRVTYTGGYETTPEDLKLAVFDLISYYQKSDMAVKSTRSPGSSATQVEYIVNATLPSHIRRVLDMYRLIL